MGCMRELVDDHEAKKLTPAEKINIVEKHGSRIFNNIAYQLIGFWGLSYLSKFVLWLRGSPFYVPNLMTVEPKDMLKMHVDMFLFCWILTGDSEYVELCTKKIQNNPPTDVMIYYMVVSIIFKESYDSFPLPHVQFIQITSFESDDSDDSDDFDDSDDEKPPTYEENPPEYTP